MRAAESKKDRGTQSAGTCPQRGDSFGALCLVSPISSLLSTKMLQFALPGPGSSLWLSGKLLTSVLCISLLEPRAVAKSTKMPKLGTRSNRAAWSVFLISGLHMAWRRQATCLPVAQQWNSWSIWKSRKWKCLIIHTQVSQLCCFGPPAAAHMATVTIMLNLLLFLAVQCHCQKLFSFSGLQQPARALSLHQLLGQRSEKSPESH